MTNLPREKLDALVKKLAREYVNPTINASLRDMALAIKRETGIEPSTSVVAASLRRIGARADGHRWIWRGRGGRRDD